MTELYENKVQTQMESRARSADKHLRARRLHPRVTLSFARLRAGPPSFAQMQALLGKKSGMGVAGIAVATMSLLM